MTDGILVINKPAGLSSAAVVARLKRKLKVKKIGHTGTLDPFATGVLLIAIEKATRISRFFLDGSKAYLARVTLGVETDTYDCTGQAVTRAAADALAGITLEQIQAVAARFQGVQDQVAPAYSALKHNGVPLYKLARQGISVQKPPRSVEISRIEASNLTFSQEGHPVFDLFVDCSGGTYIRSLAFDIGRVLGCGAHLSGLIRTRSSQFDLSQAMALDTVERAPLEEIAEAVIPMSQCLADLPKLTVQGDLLTKIGFGQKLVFSELPVPCLDGLAPEDAFIRVVDPADDLLAVVQPDPQSGQYNYCCVFSR